MIEVELVALYQADFTTHLSQATIQTAIDVLTAQDYRVVAADGWFVYLQREFISAEPS